MIVTAGDRAWFKRCRRSWDLGATARRHLGPQAPPRPGPDLYRAVREALAVHYFPGMWVWDRSVVAPLVMAALDRSLADQRAAAGDAPGDDDDGSWPAARASVAAMLERYAAWSADFDDFTPLRVEADVEVNLADPWMDDRDMTTADGDPVRYRDRVHLLVSDEAQQVWIVEHRIVVGGWTDPEQLLLDERATTACWAWERLMLVTVAGVVYNELRLDEQAVRRTAVPRSRYELVGAGDRIALEAMDMIDPATRLYPNPTTDGCARCAFRAPCRAMNVGEDVAALLAASYHRLPEDTWEEGRLGGASWSMSRGARPNRFS
jgi:hypothetical protein